MRRTFIFFLSPERKPKQKKECETVLSSEAASPILVATQWARFAQTAFRISFLVLHSKPRLNMAPKIGQSLKTSSCGVFSKKIRSTKCGNRLAAWLVQKGSTAEYSRRSCAPAESDKRDL